MVLAEKIWFAPLNEQPVSLASAWEPADPSRAINDAASFTIALESVMIPKDHAEKGWLAHLDLKRILTGERDALIYSTCQLGSQPAVQRVHYFGSANDFAVPFTSFVSENVYLTTDFHPPARINLLFQVAEVDTGADERQSILDSLSGIATKLGAVYPAILPYAFVGGSVGSALNKVISAVKPSDRSRISRDVNLYPAGRIDDVDLQVGRYVLLDTERDSADFQLQPDGGLTSQGSTKRVDDFPYIVFRIDQGVSPVPDFIVSQRIATLLTQIGGSSNDPLTSTLGFLSQTLDAYTGFNDLQRYHELLLKQKSGQTLSPEEQALLQRIAAEPDLKDYLPT